MLVPGGNKVVRQLELSDQAGEATILSAGRLLRSIIG